MQLLRAKASDSLRAVLDLDLTVDDELAAPDINVIPTATGEVRTSDAPTVGTEVKLEASPAESVYRFFLRGCNALCQMNAEGK